MTAPTTDRSTARTAARRPRIDRDTALRLAATEYDRFAVQLRALGPEEWSRPTDCPAWDVRAMAGHVLGMAEMVATVRQFVAQNVATARAGGGVDALTAHQVRRRGCPRRNWWTESPPSLPGQCAGGAACPARSGG